MDRYAGWLQEQRYSRRSTRYELRMAAHAAAYLKRRAVRRIEDVSAEHLAACHLLFRRSFLKRPAAFMCWRGSLMRVVF
jgi:hypothetical protein